MRKWPKFEKTRNFRISGFRELWPCGYFDSGKWAGGPFSDRNGGGLFATEKSPIKYCINCPAQCLKHNALCHFSESAIFGHFRPPPQKPHFWPFFGIFGPKSQKPPKTVFFPKIVSDTQNRSFGHFWPKSTIYASTGHTSLLSSRSFSGVACRGEDPCT